MAHLPNTLVMERPPSTPPRVWSLTAERLSIGRDPASDVVVDDPRVSRHHADLLRDGPSWSIVDTGSANGTFVNGARVDTVPLHPGDRIALGDVVLMLTGDVDETDETPSPFVPSPPVAAPEHPPPPPPPPRTSAGASGSVTFRVRSQTGHNENIGRDKVIYDQRQWIQHKQGALAYVASLRGRARHLVVAGVVLYLGGTGMGIAAVLMFQKPIFDRLRDQSTEPPEIPAAFFPLFAAGAFACLIGMALLIFGLIAKSGARREERWLQSDISEVEGWHG